MKKIITIVVSVLLLIPFVVKADMIKPDIFYNKNSVVGGTVEESILFKLESVKLDNFTIEYDPKFLSITEKDVEVIYNDKNILADGKNGSVKVENGKIIVNVTNIPEVQTGVDWDLGVDSTQYYMRLKFTAIGAGETKISTDNYAFFPTKATVKIAEKECPTCEKCDSNNAVGAPDTTEPSEPTDTSDAKDTTGKEVTKPTKEEKRNKDLFFYISLGANVVLLLALIIVIAKKRPKMAPAVENTPVTSETPEVQPEPENKE